MTIRTGTKDLTLSATQHWVPKSPQYSGRQTQLSPAGESRASRPPAQGSLQRRFCHICSILDNSTEPDIHPGQNNGSEPPFHDQLPSNIPLGQKHSPGILTYGSSDTLSSHLGSQLTGQTRRRPPCQGRCCKPKSQDGTERALSWSLHGSPLTTWPLNLSFCQQNCRETAFASLEARHRHSP